MLYCSPNIYSSFHDITLYYYFSKKQSNNNLYSFDVDSVQMDIENRNVQLSMHPTKSTMCIFFNTECDLCIKEILYIKIT